MKFTFSILAIIFLSTAQCASITKADEITYDFLVETGNSTGYCDHIPVFKKIFETIKVKTLLEFGLGYSTKYFLDHCTKVISVEVVTNGAGPEWIRKFLDLYKGYSNWVPVAYFSGYKGDFSWAPYKYFGSEALAKADSYFGVTRQSYAGVDPSYIKELQTFINNLAKYNKIDVALVDPAMGIRAEFVQLLFGKIPVIISHDLGAWKLFGIDSYGFANLKVPEDYEEIYINKGKGTGVWVQKKENFAPIIQALKEYEN